MNRETKFRAWNKDKSIMVYSNEDNERTWWDGVRGSDVEIVNQRFKENSLYDWMQYTGLRDGKGNEIYEGDILLKNNSNKFTVSYKNGAFIRHFQNSNIYLLYDAFITDGCLDDYEVIGNIYEDKLEVFNEQTR